MKIVLFLSLIVVSVHSEAASWSVEQNQARKESLQNQLKTANSWISPTIRADKHGKMSVSAFSFYRGSAHLYYADLNQGGVINQSDFASIDAKIWIQGDMHVQNYGVFDNDKGEVVFDLNDFDESWVTSYLYDVWRAAISITLIARENDFSQSKIEDFIDAFSESYLDQVEEYRGNNNENSVSFTEDNTYGKLDDFLDDAEDGNSRIEMLDKWSEVEQGKRYFKSNQDQFKLASVANGEYTQIADAVANYHTTISSSLNGNVSYFAVKSVARRLNAGTGSLGVDRYYVLVEGESTSNSDDRILDIKQQRLPSIYPHLSVKEKENLSQFNDNAACRVIIAQRALLNNADNHLGCVDLFGLSFSIRERSPYKGSFDTSILTTDTRFTKLAEQWGKVLASAHARADKDFDSQFVSNSFESILNSIVDGKHSEFRHEVRSIAQQYADQVEVDYQFFKELLVDGQLD